MRVSHFAGGCILTQANGRVRSDFYQVKWVGGEVSHHHLKYAHQQVLMHFKTEMDLILLPFSGQKLVSFQRVAAKGNMMFQYSGPRQGTNEEQVLQGLGRF